MPPSSGPRLFIVFARSNCNHRASRPPDPCPKSASLPSRPVIHSGSILAPRRFGALLRDQRAGHSDPSHPPASHPPSKGNPGVPCRACACLLLLLIQSRRRSGARAPRVNPPISALPAAVHAGRVGVHPRQEPPIHHHHPAAPTSRVHSLIRARPTHIRTTASNMSTGHPCANKESPAQEHSTRTCTRPPHRESTTHVCP